MPGLFRHVVTRAVKALRDALAEVEGATIGLGTVINARIVDPVFFDKDGEKQNV